jgi:hypothetical protein
MLAAFGVQPDLLRGAKGGTGRMRGREVSFILAEPIEPACVECDFRAGLFSATRVRETRSREAEMIDSYRTFWGSSGLLRF